MRRGTLIALLVCIAATTAKTAYAQPAPAPAADGVDPADAAFRRGNSLYKQQRYAEAKASFEEAFRLKKSHDIASNLGYAELKLGLSRDAAEHLAFAVKNWPPTGKSENRDSAARFLGIAKAAVTTLTISVSVDGATVRADGKVVGTSPLGVDVFVDPGVRTITATLAGYQEATQTVQAAKGAEVAVKLQLVPDSVAHLYERGPGPDPLPVPVAPGGPRTGVLVAGGAVAGVGLIAGIAFLAVRGSKGSDAETQRSALVSSGGAAACGASSPSAACAALHDTLKARATFGDLGVTSFILAGSAGAATLIYGLVARGAKPSAGVQATPLVLGQGGGLLVQGSW